MESCFDKKGQAASFGLTFEKCCNTQTHQTPVVNARDRQQVDLFNFKVAVNRKVKLHRGVMYNSIPVDWNDVKQQFKEK